MTKKITITINGSRFDIDVEAEFAEYLQQHIEEDLNLESNNSFKTLLEAYIRTYYALYEQEQYVQKLLEKCEDA